MEINDKTFAQYIKLNDLYLNLGNVIIFNIFPENSGTLVTKVKAFTFHCRVWRNHLSICTPI